MNYWKMLFFVFLLWPGFESTAQTTEASLSESEILPTTLLSSDDLLNPVRINASTMNGNLKLTSLEIMAKSTNETNYIETETKSSEGLSFEGVSRETNTSSQSDSSSYDEEVAKVMTDGIDSNDMTNDSATSGDAAIDERHGVLPENDNAPENDSTVRGLNGSDVDERDPSVEADDLFAGPDTKTDEPIFQFSDPTEKNFFGITDDGLPVTETTTDLVLPLAFYDSSTKVGTSTYEDVEKINLEKSSPEREVKTVAEGNVDTYESDSISDVSDSLSKENVSENDDKSIDIEDRQETTIENEGILLTVTPIDAVASTENSGYDSIHKNVTISEEKVDVFTESTVILEKEAKIQLLSTEPSTQTDKLYETTTDEAVVEETDSKDDSKSDSGSALSTENMDEGVSVTVKTADDIGDVSSISNIPTSTDSESLKSITQYDEHKATSLGEDLSTSVPKPEDAVASTSDESKSIISESVEDRSKYQSVDNIDSLSVDINDSTEEEEITAKTSLMSSASQQKENTNTETSKEYMPQDGEEKHSDENVAIENITASTLNIDIASTANENKTNDVLDQSRFEAKLAEIINEGESNSISDESKLNDNSYSLSSVSQENEEPNKGKETELSPNIVKNSYSEDTSMKSNASTLNIEVNTVLNDIKTDNITNESKFDNVTSEIVSESESESIYEDLEQSGAGSAEMNKSIVAKGSQENSTFDKDLLEDKITETTTELLNKNEFENSDSSSSASSEEDENTTSDEEDLLDKVMNTTTKVLNETGLKNSYSSSSDISEKNKENTTSDEAYLLDDKVMEITTEVLNQTVLDNSDSISSSSQQKEGQTEIDETITSLNNNSNEGQSVKSIEASTLNIEVNTEVNENQTNSIIDESMFDSKSSEMVTEIESNSMNEDVEQSGRGSLEITKNISSYISEENKENTTSDEADLLDDKVMEITTEVLNETVLDDSDSISSSSQQKEGQTEIDELIISLNNNSNEGESVESIEASTLNIEVNTEVNEDETDSIVDESRSDSKSSEMVTDVESNSTSENVEQSGRGSLEITKNISSYISEENKENTTSEEADLVDDKVMETTTGVLNEAVLDNSDSISSSSQQKEGQTEINELITSLDNNSNEGQSVESIEASTLNIEVNTEVNENQTVSIIDEFMFDSKSSEMITEVNTEVNEDQPDSNIDESMFDSKSSDMVTEIESNIMNEDVAESGRGALEITKNISSYVSEEDTENTTSDEADLVDDKVMETKTEVLNEAVLDDSDSISSSSQQKERQAEIDEIITSLNNDSNEGQSMESIEASTLNIEVNTEVNENQTDSIIDESMFDSKSSEMVTEIESNIMKEDVEESGRGALKITKNISSYVSEENKENTTSDEADLVDDEGMGTTTGVLNEAVLYNSDSISSSSQQKEGQTEINDLITSLDNNANEGQSVESIEASTLNIEVNTEVNENQTVSIIDESKFDSKSSEMVTEMESNSMSEDVEQSGRGSLEITKNISSYISEENKENTRSEEADLVDDKVVETKTEVLNEAVLDDSDSISSNSQQKERQTEIDEIITSLNNDSNEGQSMESIEASTLNIEVNTEVNENQTDSIIDESMFDSKSSEMVTEIESNIISEDVEESGRGELGITKNISSYISEENKENTTSEEADLVDDKVMETTTEVLNEAVLDNSDSISSSSQQKEGQTEINELITSLDNNSNEGQSMESIEASTLNIEFNSEVNENQTDSIIDESMLDSKSSEMITEVNTKVNEDQTDSIVDESRFDSKASEMVTDIEFNSMSEDVEQSGRGSLEITKNISSDILEENEESITLSEGEILDEVTEITTDLLNKTEAESYSSSSSSQQKEALDTERSKNFTRFTSQDNVKHTPDEVKSSKNVTSTYSPLIVLINIKIKVNKTGNVHVESEFDNKTSEVIVENIETAAPGDATNNTTVTVIKSKEYTIDADEVTEVNVDVNKPKITTSTDMTEETVYRETSTESDAEDISEEITTARDLLTTIASVTNDFENDNSELFTTTIVSTEFVEEVPSSGERDENFKLYANDFADSEDKIGDTIDEDYFQVEANVQNETKISLSHPSILEEDFIDKRRNSTLKEIGHNESTNVEGTDVESDDEEIPELEDGIYESSYIFSEEFGSENFDFPSSVNDNVDRVEEEISEDSVKGNESNEDTKGNAPRGAVINAVLNNLWNILSRRFDSSKENISSPTPNSTKDVITTEVPYIQDTIFGRSVNFSIQIVAKNETMYVPTTAYLWQDPSNYTLNITWQSSSKGLNNSLWLSMMSVSRYLVMNGAQMRIAKDGEMSIWKGESIVIPKVTSTANYTSIIKFEEGVVVYLTSPDEDFLQPSNETENKLKSNSEDFNIEIAMGATVSALILVVLIFVFVIKGWRRAHRREFKPELYYAV